jgi:2-keto-4-pentenoate hydratase/2-oxohepta-3-ene-1,7-dioic acid hydratase in catechol pathway
MKIASYRHGGVATYGVVAEGGLVDMGRRFGSRWPSLDAVLAGGTLDQLREAARGAAADHRIDAVEFLPVLKPEKMVCIGLNYVKHVEEMGRKMPTVPSLFLKLPSALAGHGQDIVKPAISDDFDYEGELVVVIGKACHRVSDAAAPAVVGGYTILNDGSIRDWQKENVCAGKNFPRTSGFGPWLVTADEIPDPGNLEVETRINGKVVQRDSTSGFIFSVSRLISFVSTFTPLAPGDIISTGTPSGVAAGRTPPTWMKPGDVVEVEISGIGTLRNRVVAEE